ncbi:MAG: hypothetical protein AAF960_07180 [Bacteroidota bacterium]
MPISNKLLSLLATFSKYELSSFGKFVCSPFHNEQQDLVKLFSLIDAHLRQPNSQRKNEVLEKEVVWKKIYGHKPFKDVRLRRLCSDLIQLIYQFLAYNKYQKQAAARQFNLVRALNRLDLQKYYTSAVAQLESINSKNNYRNAAYHLSNHTINAFLFNTPNDFQSKKKLVKNFEAADYHLECFYITKKLENFCAYISYKSVISFSAQLSLPPNFLDYVAQSSYVQEPSVKAFYLVAKMMTEFDNSAYFAQLKNHLERHTQSFTLEELDTFYISLKNYCIAKINKGVTEYYQQLFEINKVLIREKIVLKNGIISHQGFKNIVTVGLKVEAYQWVEDFIQEYAKKLPLDHQDNALAYNLAKVYFYQEEYSKVIELLKAVVYKNHVYALGGKLMLLKTYYELGESVALDSLIDSFRIYIRRNKIISREIQQQYLNLLRFVKKLSRTFQGDVKGVAKIRAQIDKCKALAGKKWILEKVEELV